MDEFKFKEEDATGFETLDVIADADRFNAWMYQTILPYCHGDILEIGSGIGNISNFFVSAQSSIVLSDIRSNYCEMLSTKFPDAEVINLDLVHPDFDDAYKLLLGKFDTVFALNVVEHIKNDVLAVGNCAKLLKPGGTVVVLVPAYQLLYNRFDRELEHFRRYTRKSLKQLFTTNGFQITASRYFNAMGILGWIVSGGFLKRKTISGNHMALYDKLVPVWKVLDVLLLRRIGLSVIVVGRKK